MLRRTGPGKSRHLEGAEKFLLFNFDIDGEDVKAEHRIFLEANVVPTLKAGGSVRLIGLADRSGSNDYNLKLSERRIARTLAFLRGAAGNSFAVAQQVGKGERLAELKGDADGSSDEVFRGVMVFITTAPTPPPPEPEPAPTPPTAEPTGDIYIKIFGYDRPEQQGMNLEGPEAKAFRDEIESFPGYLKAHRKLTTIWVVGGEGAGDKTNRIVELVGEERKKGPLGRVIVTGGSAGGRMALNVASKLTTGLEKAPVVFVGIADGAFQRSDMVNPQQDVVSDNPVKFKSPNIICGEKINLYQSWGHTLDPQQELHGELAGFNTNTDLFTPGSAVDGIRIAYEANLFTFNRAKQAALEAAHTSAYLEAFRRYAQRAREILKTER